MYTYQVNELQLSRSPCYGRGGGGTGRLKRYGVQNASRGTPQTSEFIYEREGTYIHSYGVGPHRQVLVLTDRACVVVCLRWCEEKSVMHRPDKNLEKSRGCLFCCAHGKYTHSCVSHLVEILCRAHHIDEDDRVATSLFTTKVSTKSPVVKWERQGSRFL